MVSQVRTCHLELGLLSCMRAVERKDRKSLGPAEIIGPLNAPNPCLLPDVVLNTIVDVSMLEATISRILWALQPNTS